MAELFDPIAALATLDRQRVAYIIVGGLGRVIHGSDELTSGIDIVPSMREDNLRRLGVALEDLNARRPDGTPAALADLDQAPLLDLQTTAGELKIIPEPAGTRGYDDLRRAATREPLGQGVRPPVASVADQARMLAALDRDQDAQPLHTLRRLIEIQNSIRRGADLGL
jgi:hypothetical protein